MNLKSKLFISASFLTVILTTVAVQATPVTVATFEDPAIDASTPLFTVDWGDLIDGNPQGTVNGGWSGSGLDLTVNTFPGFLTYQDVRFEMSELAIESTSVVSGKPVYGETGSGTINFYFDNIVAPVLTLEFDKAFVSIFNLGSNEFYAKDVTITGWGINKPLENEVFGFSFANIVPQVGGVSDGFTATAAFTSSAEVVPEPITMAILMAGFGLLKLRRR